MPTDEPQLHFGVWLELPPHLSATEEEILRPVLPMLQDACNTPGVTITLAMPAWSETAWRELLKKQGIPGDRLRILTSRDQPPVILRLSNAIDRWLNRPPRPKGSGPRWVRLGKAIWFSRFPGPIIRWLAAKSEHFVGFGSVLATTSSPVIFALIVIPLAILSLLSLPFIFLWKLLRCLTFWRKPIAIARSMAQRLGGRFRAKRLQTLGGKRFWLLPSGQDLLISRECRLLAKRVNECADVKVWLVPHPTWINAALIKTKTVVASHDFLYSDLPIAPEPTAVTPFMRSGRELVQRAAATIAPSRYVVTDHLVQRLSADPQRARVIPLVPGTVMPDLKLAVKRQGGNMRMAALSVLLDYMAVHHQPVNGFYRDYLYGFPFDEAVFLFVPPGDRCGPNLRNLCRAMQVLMQRKFVNLKLFIAGIKVITPEDLRVEVYVRGMGLDIIALPPLPANVQAAFYHLATATVIPSLFESSCPQAFGESLSVGTPVLMSSTPATREVIPKNLADVTLFDPHSVESIVGRIEWALAHRDELSKSQGEFYEKMSQRTWADFTREHLELFRELANEPVVVREAGSDVVPVVSAVQEMR